MTVQQLIDHLTRINKPNAEVILTDLNWEDIGLVKDLDTGDGENGLNEQAVYLQANQTR